ncbi:MAG: hypothetical protein JKY87_06400, partial [Mariprofundus sp.]|nr:hypothetical protein [Mariprofundus sp.]
NSEAHIKKAELLHAKQDKPAFAAAVALATSILAVSELERYNAAIEAFGGTVDVLVDEPEGAVDTSPVTMAIDDVDMDDLDFDLTGLDIGATDSGIEVADIGLVSDVSDQVEPAKVESAESEADEVESVDELDWLSDPAFAIAAESQDDIEIQFDALPQSDMVIDSDMAEQTDPVAPELQTKSGATQQLGSLLGEFSGEETIPMQMNEDTHAEEIDGVDETVVTEAVAVELQSQATQDLDDLLIDSSQQDDVEDGLSHLAGVDENVDDVNAPAATDDAFEAGATQHLDNLLGEFSDDDDLSFIGSQDSFDADVIEQGKTAIASSGADAVGMATDYGATQELDSLLAEFADEDDGLSFIDPIDVATTEQKSFTDMGLDHGATQELDSLLGEFIDANDTSDGSDDIDQGATQVLGHLLDEFSDDIDEDDKKD